MLSPNYVTRACKKGRGMHTVPALRGKSSWNHLIRKIKCKERLNYQQKLQEKMITENYDWKLSVKIMSENYHQKLWVKIIRENYLQKLLPSISNYQWRRKVEIYRDTGVSKKLYMFSVHILFYYSIILN